MAVINSLRDLLIDEVKVLYNAENQLVKALPKMARAAADPDLRKGFNGHLKQTKQHVTRLKRVLKILRATGAGKTCHAMKGLVAEGAEAMKTKGPGPVRDASLIGAAQRVEHYEMAAYGTVRAFAKKLGERKVSDLLQETLNEEGETNKKLVHIASVVNEDAYGNGRQPDLVLLPSSAAFIWP